MGWLIGKVFGGVSKSLFGYLDNRGARQLSREVALQQRLQASWGDELIIIWFLVVLSAFLIPWSREAVSLGFVAMSQSLPPSFEENFHLIVASVFGFQATQSGIRAWANKNKAPNPIATKIPREF